MKRQNRDVSDRSQLVASLRATVLAVARELEGAGLAAEASLVREAGDLRSSAADEVLAMREALVRTRRTWQGLAPETSSRAAGALSAAKRLSITL